MCIVPVHGPHGCPLRVAPCPPRGSRFALGRPGGKNLGAQRQSTIHIHTILAG
jgi:hypothetical protein